MRILYVLRDVKHPSMRGELRHYHFLRLLARRHSITLVALASREIASEAREELSGCTERLLLFDATSPVRDAIPRPVAAIRARVERTLGHRRALDQMQQTLERLTCSEQFDIVLTHGPDLAHVIARLNRLPIVADLCDASSMRLRCGLRYTPAVELPWRWYRYWQARKAEQTLVNQTPYVVFISQRDRDAILPPGCHASVIPNGVDLAYWKCETYQPVRNRIVFTGVMDYPPNADAALCLVRDVVPEIRRSVPDVEVVIAGRNPTRRLTREVGADQHITVTGYVDDLRPHLAEASVFVAPLRFGSGTQNKILEALAMQRPVVTTPVAAAGLKVDDDDPPVLVGNRPRELAAHVVRLLKDASMCQSLGAAGREFARRHFNWERGADALERLCRAAATRGAMDAYRSECCSQTVIT